MQTDREKDIKEPRDTFLIVLPELIQSHSQCFWLLTQRHSAYRVQRLNVQNNYCTNNAQTVQ